MKFPNFVTTLSLTAILVIAQMIDLPNQKPKEAQAQSNRPYVVFVNGYMDCCVWSTSNRGVYMGTVMQELEKQGAEFRLVPWDTFRDNAGQRSSTSNDAAFLQEAADFINNQLDPNRPLILIGHSFGGDSLLSLVPRIKRRIQFLGVIDPTAAGGLREPVTRRGVPSNVDYFFNRWQKNGLNSSNVVPFDSRLINGSISGCQAKKCDQQEQNLARRENGSPISIKCESWEVTCDGYNPIPVALGGSNGTKSKRLAHNDMPSDAYLQRQMANSINSVLVGFKPNISLKWSQAGPISGMQCTRIYEDADPHAWSDNYLCSNQNLGLRWSQAGPISGMQCTRIYEDADPYPWSDNYLCF